MTIPGTAFVKAANRSKIQRFSAWQTTCTLAEKCLVLSPAWPEEKLIENSLNRYLANELSAGEFDFLRGYRIGIEALEPRYAIEVVLEQERFQVKKQRRALSLRENDLERGCDVLIKGRVTDLLQILLDEADPDTLFFQRKIMIEGDTELGLGIKNQLDAVGLQRLPRWLRQIFKKAGAGVHQLQAWGAK